MKRQIKKTALFFAIILIGFNLEVKAQIINTIAGNGANGYTGDGSLATNAKLNGPDFICLDAVGNIYFSDSYNNRIRKVTVSTGIISLVAGDGTQNFGGDGGLATLAKLDTPTGLALDGSGNLYFADGGNSRIRKINLSSGIITTVYGTGILNSTGDGGPASSADIWVPNDIKFDAAGNLFLAEPYKIRKITVSSGIITTVAGNGTAGYTGDGGPAVSAQINIPLGIALDAVGNIYFADSYNHMIRKVTVSSGIISSIVGNGAPGYAGDGGLATSAQMTSPRGVFVDAGNNIFIKDAGNFRIRKVTFSTGIINTIVGNGTAGFSGDGGLATSAQISNISGTGITLDAAGNLYFCDSNNDRIRKVAASTTSVYESMVDVNQINVFPNPTSDQLNISGILNSQKLISITNVVGEVVKTVETNGSQSLIVDVKNLSPGVYFIVSSNKVMKFIKE